MSPLTELIGGAKAYGLNSNVKIIPPTVESIASSVAGSGGTSSSGVTFSSIPGTYSHLQLRLFFRCSVTGSGSESLILRVNGDTGTNYSAHRLYGDGTSAFSNGYTTSTVGAATFLGDIARSGVDNGGYTILIIDILDYANTNKYKTFKSFTGRDHNGSGRVGMYSSLWLSTSAVTSISIAPETTGWQQYSHFALYGIKGA